jgi:hypothetical protein
MFSTTRSKALLRSDSNVPRRSWAFSIVPTENVTVRWQSLEIFTNMPKKAILEKSKKNEILASR